LRWTAKKRKTEMVLVPLCVVHLVIKASCSGSNRRVTKNHPLKIPQPKKTDYKIKRRGTYRGVRKEESGYTIFRVIKRNPCVHMMFPKGDNRKRAREKKKKGLLKKKYSFIYINEGKEGRKKKGGI